MSRPLIVLKFGSSVLRTEADLPSAVHEIYRYARDGFDVAAVVSAFEGVTDRLFARARGIGADASLGIGVPGLAALVACGERESAAALQIALANAGLPAHVLDPLAAGLRVEGDGLSGEPVALDVARCRSILAKGRILIVPGFFGTDADGGVSLLGRGGSDWTALFLAQRLGGRCRLLKDTDGIYDHDPNDGGTTPLRFECLSYDDALALHAPVVQEAALRFARAHGQTFEVAKTGSTEGTTIGRHATRLAGPALVAAPPLRVVLLGLGAVGRGVYEHLRHRPEAFKIVAIAVRDRAKHTASGVPLHLLRTLDDALRTPADIVVEAIGGVDTAGAALARALGDGRHVVTANKAVIAARGVELERIAEHEEVRLLYSAAVGGVLPVLETVRRFRGRIASIEGVLNGTSNFVLDRLTQGEDLETAVSEAQRLGYAEADPTDDLSGLDAARKLTLIAREAFGVALEAEAIPRPGVDALRARASEIARANQPTRMIAAVDENGARVTLATVDTSHPLAACRGADNAVVLTLGNGERIALSGRGAGRWPTAESVLGDLFALRRDEAGHGAAVIGAFEGLAS